MVGYGTQLIGTHDGVDKQPQPAPGALAGIQQLERASGEIAGIGVVLQIAGCPLRVHPGKIRAGHVHLATDLQLRRHLVTHQA